MLSNLPHRNVPSGMQAKVFSVEIVMLNEAPDNENNPEVDEEISESAVESFRQGWRDVKTGNTLPVFQLWEPIDGE